MSSAPRPVRVVDTSVLSLLLKDDTRGLAHVPHLRGHEAILSFTTLAELPRWPDERNWGLARRRHLERYLATFTVRHSDEALCRVWAAQAAWAHRAGRPLPVADSWIAATAVLLGVPLVTHNPGDVARIPGLTIITEAP
jgi:predicted nucleic acid-binding protein